jgi:hypothetical protein
MSKSSKGSGPYRSAISGQYVCGRYGRSHPTTTVDEASGSHGSSGPHYRSAISGRYVTTKHGRSHPNITVKDK